MRISLTSIFLLLITSAVICQSSPQNEKPGYWMMPSPWPDNGGPLKELIKSDNGWTKTRKVINGIGYWPALLNVHFSDDEIRILFNKLDKFKLDFGFEVPVIKKENPTADDTFSLLEQQMKRFEPLGAKMKWFAFDEPFYASRHVLSKPDDYAINETAKYIKLLRTKFPNVKIGDIEPYPVMKTDELKSFISALNKKCLELGVSGIDFLRLDVDWGNMNRTYGGSWTEVKQLEDFLRSIGVKFSLIYWAADQPLLENMKLSDDMTWYIGVMHQGYSYALAGGNPDEYVIESWVQVPKRSLPEYNKSTFCASVLDFYNRFLKGK